MRVYAPDRVRRLDEYNGRCFFRGPPAVAGAYVRAYDGSAFAGPDVAAVARADHAADVGALAGAHDGAAHAEANAGSDAPARPSHGGAGLCSDAAAIGPADGGARGFDARVVLLLLLANNICANCSGNISSNEPRTLVLLLVPVGTDTDVWRRPSSRLLGRRRLLPGELDRRRLVRRRGPKVALRLDLL